MPDKNERTANIQHPTRLPSQLPRLLIISFTLVLAIAIALAWSTSLRNVLGRHIPSPTASAIRARNMTTTTATTTAISTAKPHQVTKRPWNARGHADHDWLYTFHTFSFASYHDPKYQSFGPLRVINEDRVSRGTGFGTHSHAEFLIWSYIVSGELEHRDSMGNVETLRRGEIQFTSAGTGIRHSEYNRHPQKDVHFLQIWALPAVRGLTPSYVTREYPDSLKQNRWLRIMDSVDRPAQGLQKDDPVPIAMHADLSMSAGILEPGTSVTHQLVADGPRNVYAHVVMGGREQPKTGGARVRIGDVELGEGDGAFIRASGPGEVVVTSTGAIPAEVLLFDMGQ